MRLKEYGEWGEIAIGSTIFRDRKFGRASELFNHIFEEAKKRRFKGVFCVSNNPKVQQKLESSGFVEVKFNELPHAWQEQYDLSRLARAFAHFF